MRQIIETSERQGFLFGVYLVDFLPKGHKVFLLEELLKGLNISKIRKRYKNTGGAYHDPARILSVIFYGYSEGIYSSRKLELSKLVILSLLCIWQGVILFPIEVFVTL